MKSKEKAKEKERRKLRPKAIPILTKEQFKVVVKEMERKPEAADFQRLERAKEIIKHNLV